MSTPNSQMIFNEVPTGFPIPGQTVKLVDLPAVDLTAAPASGVLLKAKSLSIDPYMRGRMRAPEAKSYSPPFELGKVLMTLGVAEVVKASPDSTLKEGQHVLGYLPMAEYFVYGNDEVKGLKVLENKEKLPWSTLVGAAGMPGRTAFYGFYEIGKPKKGETIFVSAASGAVGLIVAQLAKREGLKVIGSAGSDEKVEFLKSVGCFDIAFNYKTTKTLEILTANPPDIFFDNVGGETLENVLDTINTYGRIIACAISDYNVPLAQKYPIRNLFYVIGKQLTFQGFIISDKDDTKFFATVPQLIASGEIKTKEHLTQGLDNGEAFLDLLKGNNFGKAAHVFN